MSYYFNLEELRKEMSDSRIFTRRFETMLTFKLNSLKELCGRLPKENEAFFYRDKEEFYGIYLYCVSDKACRTGESFVCSDLFDE
jgi:hypothetical protein